MSTGLRVLVGSVLAAVLILGAAGLSGFLAFPDHCLPGEQREGTIQSSGARLWPPGAECIYRAPVRTEADGRFVYSSEPSDVRREGSSALFFTVLALGLLIVGLVMHAWPRVPRALRLTAATGLAFGAFGVGALAGGVAFGLVAGWAIGVPLAFVADRWLRAQPTGIAAGLSGAAVAFIAVPAAVLLLMLNSDLGVGAFAVVLFAVAVLSALPLHRAQSPVADGPPASLHP